MSTPQATRLRACTGLVLAAFLLAVALAPDEAVLRQKAVWGRGLILLAGALVMLQASIESQLRVLWPSVIFLALLMPLWGLTYLGQVASTTLLFDECSRLVLLALSFWVVSVTLTEVRNRQRFLTALCLSVIPAATLAISAHLSDLFGIPLETQERAYGNFGNPIFLGAFLVLVLPLCIVTALFDTSPRRWLGALATGIGLPALLATRSLGSWGAFGFSVLIGSLLLMPQAFRKRAILVGTAAAMILALASWDTLTRPRVHTAIWGDTLVMIDDHPGGVGPGQYHIEFPPYASERLLAYYPKGPHVINDVHNEPLQILAELGPIGLAAFATFLWIVVKRWRSLLGVLPQDRTDRLLLVGAMAGLSGHLALSLVSPDLRFLVTTLLFGALLGFTASFDRPKAFSIPGGIACRGIVFVVGLLGIAGSWHITADRLRPPDEPVLEQPKDSRPTQEDLIRAKAMAHAQPDNLQAQLHLGQVLFSAGRPEEASDALAQAVALNPNEPAIVRALAIAEGEAGRHQEALHHLIEVRPAFLDDPFVTYGIAYCNWRLGNLKTALQEVEGLLEREPDHPQGLLLLERLRE
ncbi:MAG: tetratricopeptide repeat protein [Planctomycetota bacterium]|nr:tetratricopeptide repeat protein [Planctomycetota bacterium]